MRTTRVNRQRQSHPGQFFGVGYGWYCLICTLQDYSGPILAWDLKGDMTSQSVSEVVQQAVARRGVERVPVEDRVKYRWRAVTLC